MKLAILPETIKIKLDRHTRCVACGGQSAIHPLRDSDGKVVCASYQMPDQNGVPVFHAKPLNELDGAIAQGKVVKAVDEHGTAGPAFVEIFRERVTDVSDLLIGDESFDAKSESHRTTLGWSAVVEIGGKIYHHTQLSEIEAGK